MGVSRFDGYEFKNFSTQDGLPDNTIFGIFEDNKQRIWFRSLSGKIAFYNNDSIYTLPCNDSISKFYKYMINNSIYVDERDTLWLGSTSGFIIKVAPGWKKKDVHQIFVPGKGTYMYLIDKTGVLFGNHNYSKDTLDIYNKSLKKLVSVGYNILASKDPRVYALRLSNGTYLASLDNLLLNFDYSGIIRKHIGNSTFISLAEDGNGSILAATTNGLKIFDKKNYTRFKTVERLNGKILTGICVDSENELWCSTEGHGIYGITNRNFKYYMPENGISESKISCMNIRDSVVMIGHLDGSITIADKDSIRRVPIISNIKDLQHQVRIASIFNLKKRTLVSTGTNTYEFKNDITTPLFGKEMIAVKHFCSSQDGNLWTLRYSRAVKYDLRTLKELIVVSLDVRADQIFEDSKGLLWISGVDGVYIYDGKKITYLGKTNPLLAKRTIDIKESNGGVMWMATRGSGIVIKNGSDLIPITETEGLAGNMCRSLFIDGNIVWVATNKGLSKINYDGKKYTVDNFYASNGLLTNEVNSIIRNSNKLWLAHNNGITIFDPTNIKSNAFSPPIYITKIVVNDSIFNKNDLTHLAYDQNYFTIHYVGLCFKNGGNVEYRYKMDGVDSAWIYTHYTSVKYQTLPAGKYRFIVQAKNNDGFWGRNSAIMSFNILPAWWQTWWFKISFVCLLVILMTLFFRARLYKIRARERESAFLKQRISETELRALRAQMNPHFVFNAINSVQYFITRNDPESSQKYLAKFAKLIRYVIDNSKPSLIPIQTELGALNLYLELESLRFENRFKYEINVSKQIDINNTQIPSMLIQPYVENAIWHGLMHKNGQGKIEIVIALEKDILKCSIKDDGIGRKRSAELKQGNLLHKSVGMSLTKERLDIINQMNNTDLSLVIHDLQNEKGDATGTLVELNIPLQ